MRTLDPVVEPPRPDVRRLAGRAGHAMADQLLSSGTALLLIVLVAREGTPATFGALNVAILVHGLLLGSVRAAIGEVLVLRCRRNTSAARSEMRLGLSLGLLAGAGATIGVGVAATVLGGEVGDFLFVVAVTAPFVYVQDLLRYVAFGVGRIDHAVQIDAVWLAAQVLASGFLLMTGEATPLRLMWAWAAGAVISALWGWVARRAGLRRGAIAIWWQEERWRSGGFVGDFFVSTGMVQMTMLLLSVVLPLDEFGALRLTMAALAPLANLLAGVRTLTLAHLASLRDARRQALRRAAQVAGLLAAAAVAFGTLLILLPRPWGAELFGTTWDEAHGLLAAATTSEAFRLATMPAIDVMKIFASPRALVRTRILATSGVVLALILGAVTFGPEGALVGAAIAYAVAAIIWWRRALTVTPSTATLHPG